MTPQPPSPFAPPPPEQSFVSKNWPWLVGAGCLVLACCGVGSIVGLGVVAGAVEGAPSVVDPVPGGPRDESAARVDCGTPGPAGVDCTITRTRGTSSLRACWSLEISCTNGGVMVGDACGELTSRAPSETVTMPVAAFSNQDACDSPTRGAVKDLVVTER